MKKWICLLCAAAVLCACLPTAAELKVQAAVQHPMGEAVYNGMLPYSARDIIRERDMAVKRAAVQGALDMTVEQYAQSVQMMLPATPYSRPAYEKDVARLAQIYAAEGGADIAQKAAHVIVLSAKNYEKISAAENQGGFGDMSNLIPAYLVMAYDLIYNSNVFETLNVEYETDTRALVETYFKKVCQRMYDENNGKYINNLGGYAIKHLAGTAHILQDPELIRYAIMLTDSALAPSQWYADGMWSEGTTSYGQQLLGNCLEAVQLIEIWRDTEEYVDELLGLKLPQKNLRERWPIIAKAQSAIENTKYPNGTAMAMHDTHPSGTSDPNRAIQAQYLNNVELNHFGLYTMVHGTTRDAQQTALLFPPVAAGLPYSGGHGHGNYLAMTYWAGGMELLPDGGYPVAGKEPNRFFHMNVVAHNNAWITAQNPPNYNTLTGKYTRPALIAYDDGTASDGMIQLIEARQLMPQEQENEENRRLLMTVKLDEERSYMLDVQRLQGGAVHENFLRGSEDEAMEVISDAPVDREAQNLGTALQSEGKQGLMPGQKLFTEAKRGSFENGAHMVWTGQTSGSSLQMFLKGVPDSEYALSSMPGMRHSDVQPPHLYQRRSVNPDDITVFGAVYEGTRRDQTAKVQNVQWKTFASNPAAALVIVDLGDIEDWIYVSDSLATQQWQGIKFSAGTAALRREKASGKILWGYVYGEGSISTVDAAIVAAPDVVTGVNAVQGDTLTLEKELSQSLQGCWCMETFGDGTNVGHKLTEIQGKEVRLNNDAGYILQNGSAVRNFHPNFEMPGAVTLRVPQIAFGELKLFAMRISNEETELTPGKSYTVSVFAPKTENAHLITVVQQDTTKNIQNISKRPTLLKMVVAPLVPAGAEFSIAQAEVMLPQTTGHVNIKSYLWDENMVPILPAAHWAEKVHQQ
ncbi:MAG: hypothetical protein HFI90_06140 [Clostridia bacterium]|nr:hypothetical protein [Clostridia bacterium]